MSKLRVDVITDRNNLGPPLLTRGASLPSGSIVNIQGNVNIVGVATVGFLTATNVSAGIITSSFIGDGSGLTGLPVADASKSIALKVILDPLPFRS